MKFKAGDFFQVQATEDMKIGKIHKVDQGSYIVEWQHFLNSCYAYKSTDVDHIWMTTVHGFSSNLNSSKITTEDISPDKTRCSHVWKKYEGFTESYDFCDLCPAKKESIAEKGIKQ